MELHSSAQAIIKAEVRPSKDKSVLLIVEVLGLGMLGIDRMYLGGFNIALGIVKLLTFSGFGIWGIIDYIAIMVNAVHREVAINTLGMSYEFNPQGIETAHALGVVGLALLLGPLACFLFQLLCALCIALTCKAQA